MNDVCLSDTMIPKESAYKRLVEKRMAYRFVEVLNPSNIDGGKYDCDHVESWAQWMGNLDARIMLVGKDFGGKDFFVRFKGRCDPSSITNRNLVHLFGCLGIDIGTPLNPNPEAPVFFTNALAGIIDTSRKGGNRVSSESLRESAMEFLRPLISIVDPRIVITMGREAYQGVAMALGLPRVKSMRELLEKSPLRIGHSRLAFPVFHCGGLGLANRSFNEQQDDWRRIRAYV